MAWNRPLIRIDRVDRIGIDTPIHPILYDLLHDYMKSSRSRIPDFREEMLKLHLPDRDQHGDPDWLRTTDRCAKVLSLLSALAIIVFVILLIAGKVTVAGLSVGTLLTVVSFTLVGALISVGGVQLFSFNASLRRARDRIERVVATADGCPFTYIIDEKARERFGVTSPFEIRDGDFCRGCQLVDQAGRTTCRVSPLYQG
jgi:hypothetical protein